MTKILFVCLGNICRSPMAEMIMKNEAKKRGVADEFEIASAATSREEEGNGIHYGAMESLRRHGVPIELHCARQITAHDCKYYDMIIAMDSQNVADLRARFGAAVDGKLSLLLSHAGENRDIADPWWTGEFESTYRDVTRGVNALLDKLCRVPYMEQSFAYHLR